MKKYGVFSRVLMFGSVAVVIIAVAVTIIITNTTLRSVKKNLPDTLFNELISLDLVLDNISEVVSAAEITVLKTSPQNFERLNKKVDQAYESIVDLRLTYVFDNLIHASDFHSVVAPAIADLKVWLSEGVSGYGPMSEEAARIVLSRIATAYKKAKALDMDSRLVARNRLDEQGQRLDRFLFSVNLLFVLTFVITLIMISLFIHRHMLKLREIKFQESLQEQSSLLNSLFENIRLGITVWSSEGELLFANRHFTRLTGYEPGEIKNVTQWAEKISADPAYRDLILKDRQTSKRLTGTIREFKITCRNGNVKDVEFRPVFLPDGRTLVTLADITERKLGEERLRYFKTAVENSSDAIGMADPSGNHWFQNKAFEEMFGDLTGRYPPSSAYVDKNVGEQVFETIKAGGQWTGDVDMYGRNGEILTVMLRAYAIKDETGAIAGLVGAHTDITENRKARAALKESEERFKIAGMASYDLIYEWDVHKDSRDWFGDIYGFLGFEPEEIPADKDSWFDLIHPDDRPLLENAVEVHRIATAPIRYEYRIQNKNGNWRYWTDNAIPLPDENNLPVKWIGACTDITERKRNEKALRESEQQMRAILEASPDPMVMYDTDGHPLYINPAFTKVFGWTLDELEGGAIPFVPEDQKALTFEKIREIYRQGNPLSFETKRYTKSRRTLDIFISAATTKTNDGSPTGMVVNLNDITQKKQLEAQYERAQKMESLGTLAGGIAHDFNNLLSGIFGYLDLARKRAEEPKLAGYLTKAFNSLERAKGLTQQLLTFSKGGEPIKRTGSLVPFIQDTTQFALSGANIACSFDLPDDLWMCDYDKNQLGQVIDNVVINAHHAMPSGGEIRVSAANAEIGENAHPALEPGRYVKISISDTGTGIPEKYISRIFDPFFTTKQKGSGLGLATSYSIIKKHGGTIDIESEVGAWTTFHIFIPASASQEIQEKGTADHLFQGKGRVLIMDDEEMIREMLGDMLENMGFSVTGAPEGGAALEAFSAAESDGSPFSAIILDLTVPGGLGGLETIKKIREINSTVPVFVASGYSEDAAIADPGAFGFTASLEKPFTLARLSAILAKHLK